MAISNTNPLLSMAKPSGFTTIGSQQGAANAATETAINATVEQEKRDLATAEGDVTTAQTRLSNAQNSVNVERQKRDGAAARLQQIRDEVTKAQNQLNDLIRERDRLKSMPTPQPRTIYEDVPMNVQTQTVQYVPSTGAPTPAIVESVSTVANPVADQAKRDSFLSLKQKQRDLQSRINGLESTLQGMYKVIKGTRQIHPSDQPQAGALSNQIGGLSAELANVSNQVEQLINGPDGQFYRGLQ